MPGLESALRVKYGGADFFLLIADAIYSTVCSTAMKPHNRTSKQTENRVVELYKSFHKPKEIAALCGVSRSGVDRILRRYGIPRTIKTALAATATEKRCTKCKQIKPVEDFCKAQRHVVHAKVKSTCKKCDTVIGRDWRTRNRDHHRTTDRNWARNHRVASPQYKIAQNCRRRIREVVKLQGAHKSAATFDLIGCTIEELRRHLEQQFQPDMSWDNYGRISGVQCWEIDHRLPCDSFDLADATQQRACFNFQNLQPLWALDNMKKAFVVS